MCSFINNYVRSAVSRGPSSILRLPSSHLHLYTCCCLLLPHLSDLIGFLLLNTHRHRTHTHTHILSASSAVCFSPVSSEAAGCYDVTGLIQYDGLCCQVFFFFFATEGAGETHDACRVKIQVNKCCTWLRRVFRNQSFSCLRYLL